MWENVKQKVVINLEIPVLNKIIYFLVENLTILLERPLD